MIREKVDVVVAGAGVAGLMAAYEASQAGASVAVLAGSSGASNFLQSLNTTLGTSDHDQPATLAEDMMRSGGDVNSADLVAEMTGRIGQDTLRLAEMGVEFSRDETGAFRRRQPAGSSWPLAVYGKGMVGVAIMRALRRVLSEPGRDVRVHEGAFLVDLVVSEGRVAGGLGYTSKPGDWIGLTAPAVVVATGGAGALFERTTNHKSSNATGYGMALAVGAELVDMEFVSFEPFVTCAPDWFQGRDMPTPVMNEGGRLVNVDGVEFLGGGRLASKDAVCRAMVREVEEGRGTLSGGVVYDVSGVPPEVVAGYVQLDRAVKSLGSARLEVAPAQHYMMGGIRVDARGASTVPGLFAVGEASGGAHGAHRLAGAGGTEAVSMGAVVGRCAAATAAADPVRGTAEAEAAPRLLPTDLSPADGAALARVRQAVQRSCGVFRDGHTLAAAHDELRAVLASLTGGDAMDSYVGRAAAVADAVVAAAGLRRETRGDHARREYPERDDSEWLGNIRSRYDRRTDGLELAFFPVGSGLGTPMDPAAAEGSSTTPHR